LTKTKILLILKGYGEFDIFADYRSFSEQKHAKNKKEYHSSS